jgi:hypothetical protein
MGRIFPLLVAGFVSVQAGATPFMGSFDKPAKAKERRLRSLEGLSQNQMMINLEFSAVPTVAPSPKDDYEAPKSQYPKTVAIPVTVGVYEAKNWIVGTSKGDACFPPEGSLIYVNSLATTKLIGTLAWPLDYQPGPPQCRDSVQSGNGLCPDGKAPAVKACADGATVLFDFSEAINRDGSPVDPGYIIEKIRRAIQ